MSAPVIRRLAAAAGLAFGTGALAQVQPGSVTISLQEVASGLVSPVAVTHAGDSRLFIVEQTGKVLVMGGGVISTFLDVSAELPMLTTNFDERGLLGLAFHPNYSQNGRFFIRYSKPRTGVAGEPCFGTPRGCHEEILAEYTVSANPNVANPNGVILFRVDKPEFNHNGAEVVFGPDGMLYWSFGDGGGAHDGLACTPVPCHGPGGNGQNINVPLGKVLRVNVNGAFPYSIPANNPFVGIAGLDEIYAYGFRNPFKFSFDDGPGGDGKLWMADVGQNMFEEVDHVTLGGNYGWVIREGAHCFDPFNPTVPLPSCNTTGLIDPIAEYSHADGISIIGGYVYRGNQNPGLVGKYVFGDFSRAFAPPQGRLFYIDSAGTLSDIREFRNGRNNAPLGLYVKNFGRDSAGELYLCASGALGPGGTLGRVLRIETICYPDCNQDGALTVADFGCFQTAFVANDPYTDCNADGQRTVADFGCFQTRFVAGCP